MCRADDVLGFNITRFDGLSYFAAFDSGCSDVTATIPPHQHNFATMLKQRAGVTWRRRSVVSSEPVGKLRQRMHDYHGVPLVVTYHPAYLLRAPAEKRKSWDDLRLIRRLAAKTA